MTAAHDTLGLKREKFERPDGVINVEICSLTKNNVQESYLEFRG